jgi:hypothetical protein
VFLLGEPGVMRETTANSLAADRRGPRQDDQTVKTKLPAGNRLRILNLSLGPTRARCLRNRPLAQPGTYQRLRKGGLDIPATPA